MKSLTKVLLPLWITFIFSDCLISAESFYKRPALFSTRPNEKDSLQHIKRFGPVGIGIDLLNPGFKMRIANIEKGSPADQCGKFKKGQLILNGAWLTL